MTQALERPTEVQQVGTVMRAPKTAELIATHLRRQIVRGELAAGETLPPEQTLMEQFGVSRPTLREAFRILEAESLIGVRRGSRGGAQVLTPDPMIAARHVGLLLQLQGTTIQDVYEARMVTEPVCARMLAQRRTNQDIKDLRAFVEKIRDMVEHGDPDNPDLAGWSRATYTFHQLIMQRCGNKTLAVQGAVLADIVNTHLIQATTRGAEAGSRSGANFRRTLKSYSKLVDLVEAKDADGAEAHWRNHMEQAAKYIFAYEQGERRIVDLFA